MSVDPDALRALRAAARSAREELVRDAGEQDDEHRERQAAAAQRLADSVLRPLDDLVSGEPETGQAPGLGPATVAELAVRATTLCAVPDAPAGLVEATAALQDLACGSAALEGTDARDALLAELGALQAELERSIRTAANGPYLVTNVERLRDWLGRDLPVRPQLALCRCGASAIKPYCDGSHARVGFSDQKSPDRVPDRRDTYVGLQVTVYDNRGICQHSGFCTDRLATAFRTDQEPFVAPSAGRMDEIIRAVRDCPSGALSYGVDGVEAPEAVDWHDQREPAIEVSKDGPYRVTGSLPLRDADLRDAPRAEGSSREHYALCRCGQSQNKPFCSGMHWYVDFHDPALDPDATPTVFEWAGGLPALTRMTRLFYEKYVPQDPLLAKLFGNMAADHPQPVAKWLAEVFGGPTYYSGQYGGYERMISQHLGKQISEEQRTRWAAALLESARDAGLPNDAVPLRVSVLHRVGLAARGRELPDGVAPAGAHAHAPLGVEHRRRPTRQPGLGAGPTSRGARAAGPASRAGRAGDVRWYVKSLFRPRDRRSMQFAFDLWSYDDVRANAEAIRNRLRAGTMPCDGRWPAEWLEAYERWVDTGMSP